MPHPPPLPYHPYLDDGFDEPRETADGFRTATQPVYPGSAIPQNIACQPSLTNPSQYNIRDPLRHEDSTQESFLNTAHDSAEQSVVGVFQNAVDAARCTTEQSFAGSEKVGEAVNLKLTIDLTDRAITKIPGEVIDIIKREVER